MMKKHFSKVTAKIRYWFVFGIIKYLTPSLYIKMKIQVIQNNAVPRPSTRLIKYYLNSELVGAEVGVDIGINALNLLEMLNMRKLFLIDIYEESYYTDDALIITEKSAYIKAQNRLKKYKDKIEFIIKPSVEASKDIIKPLDFVYIDANHDYKHVYEDLEAWFPLVREGGVVAGHDIIHCVGVLNAFMDWCRDHNIQFSIFPPDWYFIKSEQKITLPFNALLGKMMNDK